MARDERRERASGGPQSQCRRERQVVDDHGVRADLVEQLEHVGGDPVGLPEEVVPAGVGLLAQRGHHAPVGGGEERLQIVVRVVAAGVAGIAPAAHAQQAPGEAVGLDVCPQRGPGGHDDLCAPTSGVGGHGGQGEPVRGVVGRDDEEPHVEIRTVDR